jgi:hypothetical protein
MGWLDSISCAPDLKRKKGEAVALAFSERI